MSLFPIPSRSVVVPSRNSQAGILLLEVLISVLIFAFAILGLAGLQARAIQFSVDAEDRNRAALMTNEIVTLMWLHGTTDSTKLGSEFTDWEDRLKDPGQGGLPGAAVEVDSASGLVTVTWVPVSGTEHKYETQVSIPITESQP